MTRQVHTPVDDTMHQAKIHSQLPVGATMDFNIILRDDEGRAFSSTGNFEFHYDLDVINIINVSPGKTNSTVQVHALRPGEAILRVYTNTLSIPLDDYVKVSSLLRFALDPSLISAHLQFQVGHAIAPSEPFVHKGGTIRFSVSDKLKTPGGLWNSDSEKVLRYILNTVCMLISVVLTRVIISLLVSICTRVWL